MDDLISRQAAIDAICNACGKIDCDKMDKCEKLQLPPANCSEFPNNSDTISRMAAIDALRKLREEDIEDYGCEIPEGFNQDHLDRATFAIKQLPPIQPKRGKWIHHPEIGWGETWLCDQCGEKTTSTVMGKPRSNFCPMCGADMRGGQDG